MEAKKVTLSEEEKGRAAIKKVIDSQDDVSWGMSRAEVGGRIAFIYGDSNKGIRHLLEKRAMEAVTNPVLKGQIPEDVALKMAEVIAYGTVESRGPKYFMEYQGYVAILCKADRNILNTWLLTGYKKC